MVVNGQVLPLFLYRNRLHTDYAYMKRFLEDGHRLIVCSLLGGPDEPWAEYRRRVEDHLNRLLDLGDKHYLIFGHYFVVPRHWAEAHRDHMCHDEEGKILEYVGSQRGYPQEGLRYALSSPLIRAEMRTFTRRHLDILEDLPRKDRIIGMLFEGGRAQEWYVYRDDPRWIFSEAAPIYIAEFRRFLRRKYRGSIEALRHAWWDPRVTFEKAEPPSPQEAHEMPPMKRDEDGRLLSIGDFFSADVRRRVLDTHEFFVKFHSAAVLAGPREMKRHRPDLLAGFFNEPIIDDSLSMYEGNLPVRSSPYVDFFAGPPPYECRSPKDAQPLHTLTGGLRMRRKAFIAEEDQRPPVPNSDWGIYGREGSLEDFCSILLRQGLQDIAAGCHGWWWDFQWQWYRHPKMREVMRKLLAMDRWNLQHKGRPCAQIAVIWDRDSAPHMNFTGRICRNLGHRQMIQELDRIGAPWDGYAADDLLHPDFPRRRYRLFVIPFIPSPDSRTRRAVQALQRDGVTILWGWGAGFANPTVSSLSVRNMQALTGIRFRVHDQRFCPTVYVADGDHPLQRALPDNYAYGQFARELRSGRLASPEKPLFPPPLSGAPLFAVDDPQAKVLGYTATEFSPSFLEAGHKGATAFAAGGVELHPGLAVKEMPDWTSVYSGTMMLPGRLIREVARLAGVHIYCDTEDLFFANSRMVGLMASYSSGPRTIHLPRRSDVVVDLLADTPKVVARKARQVSLWVAKYQTAVLGLV